MYKVPRAKDPESPSPKTQGRDPQRWAPTLSTNTPPPPPPVQKTPTTTPKSNQVRSPAPSLAQRPSSHTLVIGVRDSASPHDVIGRLVAPDLLLVRSTPRPLQAPRERKTDPGERHTPAGGRDGDKAARPDSLAERSRRHHRGPTAARASHVRRGAHHTPPRAKMRHDDRGAQGMATAGSRSVGPRASMPSPEFTGRPMPGLRPHPPPDRQRQRTRCTARNPRGNMPHTRGGRPRPPLPATMERHRSNSRPEGSARTAQQCHTVQSSAGTASRESWRRTPYRTRGGFAPPKPPSLVGGPHPPPPPRLSAQTARTRKKGVCVCVCEFHFYIPCTSAYKEKIIFRTSFLPCGNVKAPSKQNVANACLFEKPSPKMRRRKKTQQQQLDLRVPQSRASPLV